MAAEQLHDPQTNDGQGRRKANRQEARRIGEEARRVAEKARWLLHVQQAKEASRKAEALSAELILPPGIQRDAGIEHFLRRYHTDPEFHAKIEQAVQDGMQQARDNVILNAQGKPYLITTEDGLPANAAAAKLEAEREIRTWAEIEKLALNERERQEAEERVLICIWCGKVCESVDALAVHEDDCA